eukprot:13644505-Alexandrium_andersonii.AAC.1
MPTRTSELHSSPPPATHHETLVLASTSQGNAKTTSATFYATHVVGWMCARSHAAERRRTKPNLE